MIYLLAFLGTIFMLKVSLFVAMSTDDPKAGVAVLCSFAAILLWQYVIQKTFQKGNKG